MKKILDDLPERSPQGGERWIAAIFSALFLLMMGLSLVEDYEPRKLGVVFALLFWVPLLIIHEAGHAIVAGLCGWEVERIVIGFGRTIARFKVAGVPVHLNAVPISGFILPRPRDLQSPRLKSTLIYAGGPFLECIAALVVVLLSGPEAMFQLSNSIPMIAAQSFCLVAALGLAFNLAPHTIRSQGGASWSDGLGILMSHRLPDAYFEDQIQDRE
jgi:hypothetical protein